MKTSIKAIGYGLLVMCMLLVGMPVMAQQQEWRSTSVMRTSGSAYSPQVTAVGATTVSSMATTTESYSPAKGPRRAYDANGNWVPDSDDFGGGVETGESNQFPIGDAVLPLMICAAVFCGVIALRRKRFALKG